MLPYQSIVLILATCTSAIATTPQQKEYCGPVFPGYGTYPGTSNRVTSIKVQECIKIAQPEGRNELLIKLTDAQYFLSDKWNNASREDPLWWQVEGVIDGRTEYARDANTTTESIVERIRYLPKIESGDYNISMEYKQTGPYFNNVDIELTQDFTIPIPPGV
ncbi:hypothetical protein V8E51_001409 [Hyaloscypha variabilis]